MAPFYSWQGNNNTILSTTWKATAERKSQSSDSFRDTMGSLHRGDYKKWCIVHSNQVAVDQIGSKWHAQPRCVYSAFAFNGILAWLTSPALYPPSPITPIIAWGEGINIRRNFFSPSSNLPPCYPQNFILQFFSKHIESREKFAWKYFLAPSPTHPGRHVPRRACLISPVYAYPVETVCLCWY